MNVKLSALFAASILVLSACGQSTDGPSTSTDNTTVETQLTATSVSGDAIINADVTPEVWLSHGRTYSEQRYSPLDKINKENVGELGLAWSAELFTNRGIEATPIVVDGVMYVTSAWSMVYALDAKTGEMLWSYDPEIDRSRGVSACCDVVNRGVALWEGKIFVGTIDGRLIALDAKTGDVKWEKVTVDQSKPYTITGAPRVIKGKVMIGNGGAELGVRGYISAYDAESGDMAWRFYTTPHPDKQADGAASDKIFAELANETWDDEGVWRQSGGGGTVWDSIVYDPDLDIMYLGVGNGAPWNRDIRSPAGGDNLFLSSILALKPDTGEYVWHYQTTPGETWDYTATQHIMLADLEINGKMRKVAMQAPKNGFFYVLDRETGELLSADAFAAVNWATHVDMETGRPVEVEDARYPDVPRIQLPSAFGAHNWHPMAFHPDTGLVYVPAQDIPGVYANDENFVYREGLWNTGTSTLPGALPDDAATRKAVAATIKGRLLAWDPVAKEARWAFEHPTAWSGGILATGGDLVFQGNIAGSFAAYDAANGERVWHVEAPAGVLSGPVTYEIDGEQYVAVTTGWGSVFALVTGFAMPKTGDPELGKVLVFKLGGDTQMPEVALDTIERKPQTDAFGDEAMIARGKAEFYRTCVVCHGEGAIGGGVVTDLRWSQASGDADLWREVVIDGKYASNGMAAFGRHITPETAEDIRAYVVSRAHGDTAAAEAEE